MGGGADGGWMIPGGVRGGVLGKGGGGERGGGGEGGGGEGGGGEGGAGGGVQSFSASPFIPAKSQLRPDCRALPPVVGQEPTPTPG